LLAKLAILHRETASSGISNSIGKRTELFDYLLRFLSLRDSLARDCAISSGKSSERKGSMHETPILMFTIYHGTLDCLPDDKGSCVAHTPSLLLVPLHALFYFAETCACRRITFRCRVGFIARTPVLLTGSLLSESLISCLCRSFQSEGLHRRALKPARPTCFRSRINKRKKVSI